MPYTVQDLVAQAQEVGTLQTAYQTALSTSETSRLQAAADQAVTDGANIAADAAIELLVTMANDIKAQ